MSFENLNQKNLIPEIKKDILEKVEVGLFVLKNIDTFIDSYIKDFEDELEKSSLEESKKKELQDKLKSNLSDIKDLSSEINDIIEIKIEVKKVILSIENKFKELIREELPEKWQEIIFQEDFNIANIKKDKEDLLRAKEFKENRKETLELYDILLVTINQINTDKHNGINEIDEKDIQQMINDFKETNNTNKDLNTALEEKDFKKRNVLIQILKDKLKDKFFQDIKQKYQK